MTKLLLILVALVLAATGARAASFKSTSSGCQVQEPNGLSLTNLTWSGTCSSGFVEGPGVLRSRDCTGGTCQYLAIVGVFRGGRAAGMTVGYMGGTEGTNEDFLVVYYDNAMNAIEDNTFVRSRVPVDFKNYQYLFRTSSIVQKSKNPNLGEGLTLDEVLNLFERWNLTPGSGAPVAFSGAPGESTTGAYFREKGERSAEADRKQAEWIARRDARREERARMEATQQAQNLALAQRQQADLEQARRRQEESARRQADVSRQPGTTSSPGNASTSSGSTSSARTDGQDNSRVWIDNAQFSRCGVSTSDARSPGESLQWYTMKNVCSTPVKIHISANQDTSRFGELMELEPGASSRGWWMLTTRTNMEFIVCPARGPQGQEVRLDEPTKSCFYRR